MEIRSKTVWNDTYDGVSFEIQNFKIGAKPAWTFYLYLSLNKIPDKKLSNSFWLKPKKYKNQFSERIYYDYNAHPIISNIEWHCGCTWYSKESGFDNEKKVIKIGCDYQHLYDDERDYSVEYILEDVKRAIKSFRKLLPDYKYWCCGNGKLYSKSEGIIKNNSFYSKEYYGNEDWFKELENKLKNNKEE